MTLIVFGVRRKFFGLRLTSENLRPASQLAVKVRVLNFFDYKMYSAHKIRLEINAIFYVVLLMTRRFAYHCLILINFS